MINKGELVFKNNKILNRSIDNVTFDNKYKVSEIIGDFSSDIQDIYTIELITSSELVYKAKDAGFEWLSIKSKCQKVNGEEDLPVF